MKRRLTIKERLLNSLENNYLFVAGWLIFGSIAIVIQIFNYSSLIKQKYNETFGSTQVEYNKINKLSTNVHISNITKVLGEPTTMNDYDKDDNLKEYIFVNKLYYVDVLTNHDEKVLSYAVTSREKTFMPTFSRPPVQYNGEPLSITLNKSTLKDVSPTIEKTNYSTYPTCKVLFGVRRFWYFEGLYDGNPDDYQSVYYGINDAGYIQNWDNISSLAQQIGFESSNCSDISEDFRRAATINTFMITAPFEFMALESSKAANIKFGVDSDEVRVIN